jgi:hypothetical protein
MQRFVLCVNSFEDRFALLQCYQSLIQRLLRRRHQRLFFPCGKLCRVSLLQQGGGRLRAVDSLQRDHRDR